jgi:predicted amidohydrolase
MNLKQKKVISRRSFLFKSTFGIGLTSSLGISSKKIYGMVSPQIEKGNKLPREIWIATLSLSRITAATTEEMVKEILNQMREIAVYQPDIICLPETFPYIGNVDLNDVAETPPGDISSLFATFSRNHNCYVICPIYTKEEKRIYNAAVVLDRSGKVLGEYRKIHPTDGEINNGITPGPIDPPVFNTDFGKIGIQICFDIEWSDGWKNLRQSGAEVVFWPSAFAGGRMVNTKAWENKYVVISSTQKDTAKICDISGAEITKTGRWNPNWAVGAVNLEKVFLHTWPYVKRFKEIQMKYGRKIKITNFHEEEWTIIESRSPDLKVSDVMNEFDLKSHEAHIQSADMLQKKARPV